MIRTGYPRLVELSRGEIGLRPVTGDDVSALAAILATPDVARWWPNYDRARVEQEMLHPDAGETRWVIERDGRVVGLVQAAEETDPEFRHASIDLFLDPAVRGRGIGPEAIRLVAGWLIGARGHHRLTIDPAADNVAAIAAYRKVGFRDVGRLRRYQRMADGSWADGLLMEMLAEELVPAGTGID